MAGPEGENGGSVPALGLWVVTGSRWVGGSQGRSPSGWKDLVTPMGFPGWRQELPLAALLAGTGKNASRSCSINNGDSPYLLVFAGGLERG